MLSNDEMNAIIDKNLFYYSELLVQAQNTGETVSHIKEIRARIFAIKDIRDVSWFIGGEDLIELLREKIIRLREELKYLGSEQYYMLIAYFTLEHLYAKLKGEQVK